MKKAAKKEVPTVGKIDTPAATTTVEPHTIKQITYYPHAIYMQGMMLQERWDIHNNIVASMEAKEQAWKGQIYQDSSLKNDGARKAKLLEYKAGDPDYQDMQTNAKTAMGMIRNTEHNIERLNNEFTVAKIQASREIALMESGTAQNVLRAIAQQQEKQIDVRDIRGRNDKSN